MGADLTSVNLAVAPSDRHQEPETASLDFGRLFQHYRRKQYVPNKRVFERQMVVHGMISASDVSDKKLKADSTRKYAAVRLMHDHLSSIDWMPGDPRILEGLPEVNNVTRKELDIESTNQILVRLGCFEKMSSRKVDANLRPQEPVPESNPSGVWDALNSARPTQSLPDYLHRSRYLLEAVWAARGV